MIEMTTLPAQALGDYAVLDVLAKKKVSESEKISVALWLERLKSADAPFSVFEHTLVLLMTQSNFWNEAADQSHSALCDRLLKLSWAQLSARPLSFKSARNRLPRHVLKRAPEDIQIIYDTVYYSDRRKTSLFSSDETNFNFLSRLAGSSFWNLQTGLFFIASMVLMAVPYAREIFLGAVVGMIGASINEYTVHLGMGHSSTKLAANFRKLGLWGLWSEEINLAHRVHHSKMLVDFRAKFTNEKILNRVDAYLTAEAKKMVASRVADGSTAADQAENEVKRIVSDIQAGGHGVDGTVFGCAAMIILALPYFLINGLMSYWLGPLFFVAACVSLVGFITQSMYSHRYLHMTDQDLKDSVHDGSTTAFMRWFMTTPVAKLQTRRHFRHHHEKYDYARTVNGVIMSFSFADFVFRTGVHEAEVHHLIAMRKAGFLPSSTGLDNKPAPDTRLHRQEDQAELTPDL
jgi:hypothetical protein